MNDLESQDAFVQEFVASQTALFAYLVVLLADRLAAQDVLQEVNLTAWRKRETFQAGTSFFAWASKIAYFHVLSYRRKRNRDRLVFNDRVLDYLAERQTERLDEVDRRSTALGDCLAMLPEELRQLIRERYAPGVTIQQLARERSKSPGSVAQHLFRIRELLLRCVERKLSREATS
jgi:RNA polymerase sigma-70 factor, ECF subfamily